MLGNEVLGAVRRRGRGWGVDGVVGATWRTRDAAAQALAEAVRPNVELGEPPRRIGPRPGPGQLSLGGTVAHDWRRGDSARGAGVRRRRIALQVTLAALATAAHLDSSVLSRAERGLSLLPESRWSQLDALLTLLEAQAKKVRAHLDGRDDATEPQLGPLFERDNAP